jgi:isoleucyl-tRNA synthetase
MVSNPVGNSIVFKEDAVKNVVKNFINRFWNCYTFYKTYAAIENPKLQKLETVSKVIDQWIVARLEMTVRSTGICYDEYRFSEVTEVVEKFVDDLSNVWIRANRSRFWNTEGNGVDETAFYVLHTALNTLCRIVAPIMPFFSEHVWLDLEKKTSVHVEDYPVGRDLTLDESNLVDEMDKAKKVVTIGHCCRDEAGIKVRQALNRVYVPKNLKCVNFTDYLKEELNVKEISWVDQETVTLDTQLTEELLAEGLSREFVRVVQSLRKRTKLNVTDRIVLFVDYRSKQSEERLKLYKNEMSKKLLVSSWHGNEIDNLETFKVGDVEMGIKIQKD